MTILLSAIAVVAAQAAQPAPVDHSQHNKAQPAQHQPGEHKCCKEVNGKMECQMMKGHDAQHPGKAGQPASQGQGTSH